MVTAETIAAHSNTRETTPRHIWKHQVLTLAQVSNEDMERYCTRERLNRWYSAGEPVWMAAQSLSAFVNEGRKADRADEEVASLKRRLAGAVSK